MKKVKTTTFVTNTKLYQNVTGYLGFAPCSKNLDAYSFSKGLLGDENIRSIEYITKRDNDHSTNNYNAYLVLNQRYSLDSFTNKFPVVSQNYNYSSLLHTTTKMADDATKPINGTRIRMQLNLGNIVSSSNVGGITFADNNEKGDSELKIDMFSLGILFDFNIV